MMKMSQLTVLISGFLIVLLALEGTALSCYNCNSHTDPGCASKVPPDSLIQDCGQIKGGVNYTLCRKITQIIEFSVNDLVADSRIIRGCGFIEGNYKNRCYQKSGFGGRQEVCACSTDNCNGAHSITGTVGLTAICIVAFMTLRSLF